MTQEYNEVTQRLTRKQKEKNGKAWYKHQADMLDTQHNNNYYGHGGVSEYKRMKVNYDLFNNILNLSDFEYVCQPFGAEAGELPARMVNRDIISGKVKALMGMEMKRAFPYTVLATNPEATTRKEKEEFSKIRQFVVNTILEPIKKEMEMKAQEAMQNQELNEEQKKQIQQQIQEELKTLTPDEAKRYMQREHQDPAEVLGQQITRYLMQKENIKLKFNTGFKHGLISGLEVFYVGDKNGNPHLNWVNPIRFNFDKSPDSEFIEDGEWATYELRMTPSQVVGYFGGELTPTQIDSIYENYNHYAERHIEETMFDFANNDYLLEQESNTVRVLHCVWKSLRAVKFLTYQDFTTGEIHELIVDESYKLNPEGGDIKLDTEWIPEVYETWKIGTDIYVNMRPVPGQFKDMDNLYECKLPYYGAAYDNLNSEVTSLVDRMKVYQYYYNIVMYRLELLLASDKGKKVLMNINAIPDSAGIDIKKWQYFFESTPFMWYDPNEEGTEYADANTIAKTIDLSLISDIGKYIDLATYLKRECGNSVGIPEQVEGQIGPHEAVHNTQQNLIQSSHILEPYFDLHNHIKRNVLQALLEQAKVSYAKSKPKKLVYMLDDLSKEIINVDLGLLDNSTLGIFFTDSAKSEQTKNTIQQLAHAAMQNQKIELSDVISVIKHDSMAEAEETLKVAEENRREHELNLQRQQGEQQKEIIAQQDALDQKKHERAVELVVVKEKERRETELLKASITAASFNPDQDKDRDGVNDFVELASKNVDMNLKTEKHKLDREKFEHQKEKDKKDADLKEKELAQKKKDSKK